MIVVLEAGRIAEQGRHDDLVQRGGIYAELYPKAAARRGAGGKTDVSIHEEDVLGKAYDAVLMRRLLGYLRPYKAQVAIALAAIIAASALQLVQPWLMKIAIDRYIARGDLSGLDWIAAAFLATLLASFALEYVQTWTLQMTGQRIMYDMRMQIYGHLQRIDLQFYDRNPVGRLMTRVTTDVDVLNDLFTAGVVSIFGDVFTLDRDHGRAGHHGLAAGDRRVLGAAADRARDAVVPQERPRIVPDRPALDRADQRLSSRNTSPACRRCSCSGASSAPSSSFDEINRTHRDANVDSIFYYAVFYPAIEVVGALASALIIWFGGIWTLQGAADPRLAGGVPPVFAALLPADQRHVGEVQRPAGGDGVVRADLQAARYAGDDRSRRSALGSSGLGQSEPATRDNSTNAERRAPSAEAPSSSTTSRLPTTGRTSCLRDVSFEVRPGERVGIVGATGAGKSTLINLLLRFYDVTSGRILIDGRDVRDMDLQRLRGLFSLVLQDVHLFSGTVAANIRLGNEAISDGAVRQAAEAVHAHRFIRELPDGYDHTLGERGATLSVGQKQLLSFARALAFDPRVLILDEATSSVDTETELLIREALHVLMSGRTTLAIAHRLSTIQDMDKILVLHKGRVREMGTHQELLARRGIYYRLYQLQYQDQEREPAAISADQ